MFTICIQDRKLQNQLWVVPINNVAGIVVLSILLLAMVIPAKSASKSAPATVLTTIGENTVRHLEKSEKIVAGSQIYAGDVVTTGIKGKMTLLYSDGSQIKLNSNFKGVIPQPSEKEKGGKSLLVVLWGQIKALLRPGNKIQTKSVAAGAKGTEFILSVDQEETATVVVIEGSVEFYNDFGSVEVKESQQSAAHLGTAPTMPVTVSNAGFTIEWTLDLDRAVIPRENPASTTESNKLRVRIDNLKELAHKSPMDMQAHLDYGDALFDNRRYDDALDEFKESDRLQGGQSPTKTRIADTMAEQGDFKNSLDMYNQTLAMSPEYVPALIGKAYSLLRFNRPSDAENAAQQAVMSKPNSAEAYIALGLSLMRQPGRSGDARKAFETAMYGEPLEYRYQARSWLALCLLDENDRIAATREAEAAKKENGGSALARGNLALVYLFTDRSGDALREAKTAAALNPLSVSARVVLAQSLLNSGRVDSAASTAAQAVALDPGFSQAYYVLGVADMQRRDDIHARRNLEKGLKLSPDFMPLASTLARVYIRMHLKANAESLLSSLQLKYPDSPELMSTLGELAYEEGKYTDAIQFYQSAIDKSKNTVPGRYYSELARVLIYANRISDAIKAAQQAVNLVPGESEFHSMLGQAYEYGELDTQSEFEYRAALALDGQNALALTKLGFKNQEGDPRAAGRTAGLTFAQGFILDPAISNDLLRGGIDSEAVANGQDGGDAETFTFRNHSDVGKTQLFGKAMRNSSEGDRTNADNLTYTSRLEATFLPSTRSNAYGHVFLVSNKRGLSGQTSAPVLDDRREFRFGEYMFGYRYRFGDRNRLWLGAFGNNQKEETQNPDRDSSLTLPGISMVGMPISAAIWNSVSLTLPAISIFGSPIITPKATVNSNCQDIEFRFDKDFGDEKNRPGLLTLGGAWPMTRAGYTSNLFVESLHYPDPISDPDNTGILRERRSFKTTLAYLQWAQRPDARFRYTAQVRVQDVKKTYSRSLQELTGTSLIHFDDLTTSPPSGNKTRILPSFAADYMADTRTWLRFSASKRMTDITSSVFVPTETLLTTEEHTLPVGLPEVTRTIQLDVQRYLAPGEFLKLFFFKSTADDVSYYLGSVGLDMGDVRRSGVGVKYEKSLGSCLYGQLGFICSSSKSKAPDTVWDGATAPYHPNQNAFARFNYIDSHGSKFGVDINYDGSFYQDTVDTLPGERMTSPAVASVDINLAKENGLHNEFFLRISNLFDANQIIYKDIPINRRTWILGWTYRH